MDIKAQIRSELVALTSQSRVMLKSIRDKEAQFYSSYQEWYTKAVRVVRVLANDRLDEFQSYYQEDPKRKTVDGITYRIRDFVRGIRPVQDPFEVLRRGSTFDPVDCTMALFQTQMLILESLSSRIDGVIAELESTIASGIQDAEIDTAETLKKVNLRAAGALAGVVLETHLQRVAAARQVVIAKKNPTLGDLNEPLKKAGVYDLPVYRKIQLLADIRNLCTHQKGNDPTPEQIEDMLNGVRSVTKSVF
jgi:hypothetical protein